MKPNLNNFLNNIEIVNTKEELHNSVKECYKKYTWSQKIRIWIFNLLFKNKPLL